VAHGVPQIVQTSVIFELPAVLAICNPALARYLILSKVNGRGKG
jgi:hypothetical protein